MNRLLDKFNIQDRVAIVTGASRGLGEAIATGLAEAGATVILAARDRERLEAVAQNISRRGGRSLVCVTDVTEPSDIERLVAFAMDQAGRIDILVNNAGTGHRISSEQFPWDKWELILNTNLNSVFNLSQHVGRHMIRQRSGAIINITSIASVFGGNGIPAYAAAKGGLKALTKVLANDWAQYNIRVNAIGPGYFETDMNGPSLANPERRKFIFSRIPMGRVGQPEEIQGAALFLASDASSFMTGQTIYIDGGWLSY